eukprot:UN00316
MVLKIQRMSHVLLMFILVETKGTEVAWYVGYSPETNEIIMVSRSSTTIANWLYDLDFAQETFPDCGPDCKVHRGFLQSYQDVRGNYLNAAKYLTEKYSTADSTPTITIAGHSLAAAIATHAALEFSIGEFELVTYNNISYWYNTAFSVSDTVSIEEHTNMKALIAANPTLGSISKPFIKFKVNVTYTFGGPRVGSPAFAKYVMEKLGTNAIYQSRRSGDVVPSLPMRDTLGLKFQHPAREVYWPDHKLPR